MSINRYLANARRLARRDKNATRYLRRNMWGKLEAEEKSIRIAFNQNKLATSPNRMLVSWKCTADLRILTTQRPAVLPYFLRSTFIFRRSTVMHKFMPECHLILIIECITIRRTSIVAPVVCFMYTRRLLTKPRADCSRN